MKVLPPTNTYVPPIRKVIDNPGSEVHFMFLQIQIDLPLLGENRLIKTYLASDAKNDSILHAELLCLYIHNYMYVAIWEIITSKGFETETGNRNRNTNVPHFCPKQPPLPVSVSLNFPKTETGNNF